MTLPWRGLQIDVVRHFFSVSSLLPIVDEMGDLGLNTLHLHLSDDQGWRLGIPEYPELIERSSLSAVDGDPGGHWTQDDWDRLRTRAGASGIRLVPEFDMPSHVNAALHAVPGLSTGPAPGVYEGTEVGFCSLAPEAPETERFMNAVLRRACALSDEYVHIGGDEAHSTARSDYELLVGRAVAIVHEAGKHVVAWQEGADLLHEGDLVQVWDMNLDPEPVLRAASRGVGIILSPAPRAYLDMRYQPDYPLGLDWMGTGELRNSLEWSVGDILPGLPESAVAGVEACVWSENIRTPDELSTMILPRLAAVAEVARTGSGVGAWPALQERLPELVERWERRGLRYHRTSDAQWPPA